MAAIVNLYETRTMMQAIEKMMPVNTFLRDTFFSGYETFITENIDVDFKKGKRKMAPFVAPRVGGVVMDRQGFETKTIKVPKIAPERLLTVDDTLKRSMGESIYSAKTPEERAAELLGKDLAELDEYITRREEWMCRELLFEGKIVMKSLTDRVGSNYIEQVVDYNFTNKEVLTADDKWDTDTADILGDLRRWRLSIIQKTGRAPELLILASDVVDIFVKNPAIQKIFNTLNYNFGIIEPSIKSPAVTFVGKLPSLGLEIYSYDEWFVDDDGTEKPMFKEKHIIMAPRNIGKRLYGSITQMENGKFVTYEGTRVPKVWADEENEIQKIRVASRPIIAPEDVDSWYVAQVY